MNAGCSQHSTSRWYVLVVVPRNCGAGNDCSLASNYDIHQQHQSASRVSACRGKGEYSLRVIACK